MTMSLATVISDTGGSLPIGEWQFWVASGLALVAAFLVLKPLLPSKRPSPPCGGCGRSKPAAPARTELTIEGSRR